jgi:hypothetical protein
MAAPANDNLTAAIDITNLPYTHQQSTIEAGNEPAELLSKCFNDLTTQFVSASVWYKYTATRNKKVTYDTLGSDYDTLLSVWQGTHHPLTEVVCNDDNGNQIQSLLSLSMKKGATYYINVSGFRGVSGNLILNSRSVGSLTNDDLADAIEITPEADLSYSNAQKALDATDESKELAASCGAESQGSVWYQYTADKTQRVVFDTVSSDYNTILAVWAGSQHPLKEIVCHDGDGGAASRVSVEITNGTTYYISVATGKVGGGSLLPRTGLLVMNMSAPPPNDNMANALLIEGPLPYINSQNTGGATIESDELSPSCSPDAIASVWYLYTPSVDYDNVVFSTVNSSYDTVLSLWQGTDYPLTELACNDDVAVLTQEVTQLGGASQISRPVTKNETIYIDVGSADGETGNLILRVEEGKADFEITSYPTPSITSCQKSTLAIVDPKEPKRFLESADALKVEISTIGKAIDISDPLSYQWYQGESGDESTPISTESHFTTPPLEKDSKYWVHIANPTGTLDSETITVTVNEPTHANGIGVDAQGSGIANKVNFTGQITRLSTGVSGNNLSLRQRDEVSIAFTVAVDSKHISESADVLAVARYVTEFSDEFYMRDNNIWQVWKDVGTASGISNLTAAQTDISLPNCLDVMVYEDSLEYLSAGKLTIYVGYRLTNTGSVFYNAEPINFTVK